jgi:osmotically-inducible protein OsmY
MGKRHISSGLLLAILGIAGCSSDDADGLARVARKSADKVETMTGGAPDRLAAGLDSMRANWNELALDARVAARLRWDKELQETSIHVKAKGDTVELTGKVSKLAQRQRAVHLAQDTVGVVEVVDTLDVAE